MNRAPDTSAFQVLGSPGPVIACALHAGHDVRPSLVPYVGVSGPDRLREEDPYTDVIADVGTPLVRVTRSRFEVDLNRPRERAVYGGPDDAWGLAVWRSELPQAEIDRSLRIYDGFYEALERLLEEAVRAFGSAIVLDVHSYNHRRGGPDAPHDAVEDNPEVNLGTGSLDRTRWGRLADTVIVELANSGLDVRENVRFKGGHLARWAHERFAGNVCVLALEFKKTFMDEWTGQADHAHVERLRSALARCLPVLWKHLEEERVTTAAHVTSAAAAANELPEERSS